MDTNLDVPGIIKRAKQALNLKRDSELAEFLGVSRATVTNWAARNSIDFRLLLDKLGNTVDYNWLLLGKGNPKHQSRFCESELAQGEVQIIHNPKTAEPERDTIRHHGGGKPEDAVHQQAPVCLGENTDSEHIRLRRGGLRQRGQYVPHTEIGGHHRI